MTHLNDQLASLAQHVRDPAAHDGPPGIEPRRLAIYRELVAGNVDALLAGNFPVIRQTLDADAWRALVRGFLARHRSRTPLFTEVGGEFVAFLAAHNPLAATHPWLAELAHYEWAETALYLSDPVEPAYDPDGDLVSGVPVLSPVAWPVSYTWPVDQIGPACQPPAPPETPTCVLLRRSPDGRVHFSRLSPLLHRLLRLLADNTLRSGRDVLQQLADEAGQPDFEAFLSEAVPMLRRLHAEGVLPGTRTDRLSA